MELLTLSVSSSEPALSVQHARARSTALSMLSLIICLKLVVPMASLHLLLTFHFHESFLPHS